MTKPYTPRGAIVPFLQAIEADPLREFTSRQAAEIMDCDYRAVASTLEYARRARLVFIRKERGALRIRGTPYRDQEAQDMARAATDKAMRLSGRKNGGVGWATRPDDPRIPMVVPGWTPPQMVAPRGAA